MSAIASECSNLYLIIKLNNHKHINLLAPRLTYKKTKTKYYTYGLLYEAQVNSIQSRKKNKYKFTQANKRFHGLYFRQIYFMNTIKKQCLLSSVKQEFKIVS